MVQYRIDVYKVEKDEKRYNHSCVAPEDKLNCKGLDIDANSAQIL